MTLRMFALGCFFAPALIVLASESASATDDSPAPLIAQDPCLAVRDTPLLSGRDPVHETEMVCPPELNRLMWRTFVALIWPADTGTDPGLPPTQRGIPFEPDGGRNVLVNEPDRVRVWQTWKQDWELFASDAKNVPWDGFTKDKPCDVVEADGVRIPVDAENPFPKLLYQHGNGTLLNKLNQFVVDDNESLPFKTVGYVVDRSRSPVRYELRYNRPLYDCVTRRDSSSECVNNLPNGELRAPATDTRVTGAITARAAWYELPPDLDPTERQIFESSHFVTSLLALSYEPGEQDGELLRVCQKKDFAFLGLGLSLRSKVLRDSGSRTREDLSPAESEALYNILNPLKPWLFSTFLRDGEHAQCSGLKFFIGNLDRFSSHPPPVVCPGVLPAKANRIPARLCQWTSTKRDSTVPVHNFFYGETLPSPWNRFSQLNFQWLQGSRPTPGSDFSHPILEAFAQDTTCVSCHTGKTGQFDTIASLAIECLPEEETAGRNFPFGSMWGFNSPDSYRAPICD